MISKTEMKKIETHSQKHGGMKSNHIKNMLTFMKKGDVFIVAHKKAVDLDKKKNKKKSSYWFAGVCCKNTTFEFWILSVIVPSGSNILTLNESIINGCPEWI